MSADGPVAEFLRHLAVERQGSAHTLDAYRRDLDALQAWARTADGAADEQVLRALLAVLPRRSPRRAGVVAAIEAIERP